MLRQSQKNHTLRGHHRRTGLQEHRAGCLQVLAVRGKPCSCLVELFPHPASLCCPEVGGLEVDRWLLLSSLPGPICR